MNPTPARPEEEPPRLKRVNRNQLLLRTVEFEKLVQPDHRVRAICDLVGAAGPEARGCQSDEACGKSFPEGLRQPFTRVRKYGDGLFSAQT